MLSPSESKWDIGRPSSTPSGSSRIHPYLPKAWGTQRRFKDDLALSSDDTPGPGMYEMSRYSSFATASNKTIDETESCSKSFSVEPAHNRHPPKVRTKDPAKRTEPTVKKVLKQQTLAIIKQQEKIEKSNEERPRSSFGLGKETLDQWGRGKPCDVPGPGSYKGYVEGTFEDLGKAFGDHSLYTESTYLNSFRKRLKKISELERKYESGGLDITEKILYKQESREKTITRLKSKCDLLSREISSRVEDRCKIVKPRQSKLLQMDSPYGYQAFPTSSRMKKNPSFIVHIPQTSPCISSERKNTHRQSEPQFGTLLSDYQFCREAPGEVSEATLTGMFDRSPRKGSALATLGLRKCSTAPAMKTLRSIRQEDRIPDEEEFDEPDDPRFPRQCVEDLPMRRLRPPSFWGSQTPYDMQIRSPGNTRSQNKSPKRFSPRNNSPKTPSSPVGIRFADEVHYEKGLL